MPETRDHAGNPLTEDERFPEVRHVWELKHAGNQLPFVDSLVVRGVSLVMGPYDAWLCGEVRLLSGGSWFTTSKNIIFNGSWLISRDAFVPVWTSPKNDKVYVKIKGRGGDPVKDAQMSNAPGDTGLDLMWRVPPPPSRSDDKLLLKVHMMASRRDACARQFDKRYMRVSGWVTKVLGVQHAHKAPVKNFLGGWFYARHKTGPEFIFQTFASDVDVMMFGGGGGGAV